MKKFVSIVLCVMCVALASIGLVGCGEEDKDPTIPNFEDYEVGYKLRVYPTCEFNYKVNDECTVRVEQISVTLTQKNEINTDDTLVEPYFPMVFHISATGTTDPKYAGQTIYLRLATSELFANRFFYSTVVSGDGTIKWEYDQDDWTIIPSIYFYNITF